MGKRICCFWLREKMRGADKDVVAINQCEDVPNVNRPPWTSGLDTPGRNSTNSSIVLPVNVD